MKRTKYTAELKIEAVKQKLDKGRSAFEVSSRLGGVPVGLLYTWTRKLKGSDEKPTEDIEALQTELTRARHLKKGRRVLCQSMRVKYAFIKEHRHEFQLLSMYRVLKVRHSGYYAWLNEPRSSRALESAKLSEQICYYYDQSMGIYSSPGIYHDLKEAEISCNERSRVARLMKASQLRSIRSYKRPRYRIDRPSLVSPN